LCVADAKLQKGHLVGLNSHLILSSTLGSVVTISGNLKTNGFKTAYRELTAQSTLALNDYFIEARADTGSFGIVLPTAVGNQGKIYNIKKCDASVNTVIISGAVRRNN